VPELERAFGLAPGEDAGLGLYLHIPFCRRRCKFCYFKVYVDKNAREVERYLDAVTREARLLARRPALRGRAPSFVYFGGGTPSFISAKHLRRLCAGVQQALPWSGAREVTFECEPGTLTEAKLDVIREVGVTRLSLGVENFDDDILAGNGRAHVSKEIYRVLPWIKARGFEQLNIDLIAGMVGETWQSWQSSVARAIEVDPDSVTIYQMELPYNTIYSKSVLDGSPVAVADWQTKRDWHRYAIEQLAAAGYEVSSAYTMVKRDRGGRFVYRDSLWQGADLLALGVSSFGHMRGVHYQNLAGWTPYLEAVESDRLPLDRAFPTREDERLTREMILQLKLGRIRAAYFREKFGAELLERFGEPLRALERERMLEIDDDEIRLTREGLLRVDQLLPRFYAPEYQNARYT